MKRVVVNEVVLRMKTVDGGGAATSFAENWAVTVWVFGGSVWVWVKVVLNVLIIGEAVWVKVVLIVLTIGDAVMTLVIVKERTWVTEDVVVTDRT